MAEAGISEDIVEDGKTYEENALLKAKYVCEKTGMLALADDSGVEIEALHGMPGIFSARFLGEQTPQEGGCPIRRKKYQVCVLYCSRVS